MRYRIVHNTRYQYAEPVQLGTHILRLQPRVDGSQQLHCFACEILPTPRKTIDWLDLEGNVCRQVWFPDTDITTLTIVTQCDIETLRPNPFDYLSHEWAITVPLDYPQSLQRLVAPYLTPPYAESPAVVDWAQQQLHTANGNVGMFLTGLTRRQNRVTGGKNGGAFGIFRLIRQAAGRECVAHKRASRRISAMRST